MIWWGKNQWKREGKVRFSGLHFWGISSVFSLIYLVFFPKKYSTCDTCDSKKSTSLLEGARATRTHEKTKWRCFARLRLQSLYIDKIKCHFFAIFSLFGYESTHIHIGVHPLKSTSRYDSTFTAKAKLIYQSLWVHISLSFVGQWLDGTATRRFCNSLKTAKRLSSTAKDF